MRHLSNKEKKSIASKLPKGYEISKKLELKEKENILFQADSPFLIKLGDKLLPHLSSLPKNEYPSVTVDMGAIPFVLKGADLMRPGIQKIEGEFSKGDIVAVREEEKNRIFALGIALYSSLEIKNQSSGKSLEIYHYVGDSYF